VTVVLLRGAVGYHGRLRATVDVDMLVPRDKLEALAHALRARGYIVAHTQDMLRVYPPAADPEHAESIADLVAREANLVFEVAARVAQPATVLGHSVRIVPRGALVALKFHDLRSPGRAVADRYQDVSDIGRIIAKRFDLSIPGQRHSRIAENVRPCTASVHSTMVDWPTCCTV
jgi:hypothetical protein